MRIYADILNTNTKGTKNILRINQMFFPINLPHVAFNLQLKVSAFVFTNRCSS